MTKHSYRTPLLLTIALALFVVPATAQDDGGMTAPPWGDAGARIHFGDEDQGTLQIQYKGQFRMNVRDIGSGQDGEDITTNFGFRRNRLALMGAWSDKVSFYVQTEFTEDLNVDTLGVADATSAAISSCSTRVRFNFAPAFKLSRKFKYNLRENLDRGGAAHLDRRSSSAAIRDDTQPGRRLWGTCREKSPPAWTRWRAARPSRVSSRLPPRSATAGARTSRSSTPRAATATRAPTSARRRS
jgi:hypothetical protein